MAFIGPLPPPIGGVALANMRYQQIIKELYPQTQLLHLNTSKGSQQADLYKKKGFAEAWHFIKNIILFLKFVATNSFTIAHVFVVPNLSFIREAFFILCLKLLGKKVVIHLHAKIKGDLFLEGSKLKWFTKINGLGDVVYVLSEGYHKSFYSQYINTKKLVVLENFVDYKEFSNNIENKTNKFLYVGRLSEKKGFKTLVEALILKQETLKNLKIDVLGEFENEIFKQEILGLVETNKLTQLNFHGAQMGKKKFKYFKENSVFIFPSYFENSPIVLKEAIAAKMAIIASDIEENKIILDPFNNKEYFKAQDVVSLADKLELLHKNNTLVKQYQKTSESITHFDIDVAKQVIKNSLSF